ncbi:MAG TPA: protein kinase [Kofleriaceae bacterium]
METVGAYRVLAKLGEGGMGVVYLAEHALLGRKAAIKVLLPNFSSNADIVQRFFNEAKAVTSIADPGIVQIFDFGHHTDGSAYIVMELLEGEPLDRRLRRLGRFPVDECLRLMRLVSQSLGVAHGKGIVHRDLKPENIFVVRDPAVPGGERPKILDFGIAKLSAVESSNIRTRTGAMMGTPVYMSPEQCRGAGDVDARSDIYSIGCVMMAMLTGLPPFVSDAMGDLIVSHMTQPPPLASSRVSGLPHAIDQILQRCLAKDPAARFASMHELAGALEAVQLGHTGPIQAVPTPIPAHRPSTPLQGLPTVSTQAPHTTLSAASAQSIPAIQPKSRVPLVVLSLVGVAAVVGIVVGVQMTQKDPTPVSASEPTPAVAAVTVDAAPAAPPVAAASAETVPPDALEVVAPPDAAPTEPLPIVEAPAKTAKKPKADKPAPPSVAKAVAVAAPPTVAAPPIPTLPVSPPVVATPPPATVDAPTETPVAPVALTKSQANEVMTKNQGKFVACADADEEATLLHVMRVSVGVAASGSVTSVEIDSIDANVTSTRACVITVLHSTKFPESKGGRFAYTIHFR